MIEPKWANPKMLAVSYETFREYTSRGTLREFADSFGMRGRTFDALVSPDSDVVYLVVME